MAPILIRCRSCCASIACSCSTTSAIRRFIHFHGLRHPRELSSQDIRDFLSALAVHRDVTPNTQTVALNAVTFLYIQVLERTDMDVTGFRSATRGRKLPVVLGRDEITGILRHMRGETKLCAMLMYGSGLRVMEVVRLRIQDVDRQAPARKYANALRSWSWQYLFAARRMSIDPRTGQRGRHHLYERTLQRAFAAAVRGAGITEIFTHVIKRGGFGGLSPLDD